MRKFTLFKKGGSQKEARAKRHKAVQQSVYPMRASLSARVAEQSLLRQLPIETAGDLSYDFCSTELAHKELHGMGRYKHSLAITYPDDNSSLVCAISEGGLPISQTISCSPIA